MINLDTDLCIHLHNRQMRQDIFRIALGGQQLSVASSGRRGDRSIGWMRAQGDFGPFVTGIRSALAAALMLALPIR